MGIGNIASSPLLWHRQLLIDDLQEVPRGHPECLRDKVFVITGVLDSLWRNEAEDLIKKHSGRVTGSVSGKTTFLVTGTQAGRGKTAKVSQPPTPLPLHLCTQAACLELRW